MVLPRVATPPRRPLCWLRNLVRYAITIAAARIRLLGSPGPGGAASLPALRPTTRRRPAPPPRPRPAWPPAGRRRLRCCDVIGGRLWGDRRLRFATPRAALELVSVYPDLDSDHAERGLGGGTAILDVGAQRVKGHAPLPILLAACHLGAPQAAAHHDADALGTGAHGAQDRLLHRPPMADAPLQL